MKDKTKKILKKILKVVWIILGTFLLFITILSYIKMKTFNGSGFSGIGGAIGVAMFFAIMLGIFLVYLSINGIIFLIKFIKKRNKK